jgi:hypothetical protein
MMIQDDVSDSTRRSVWVMLCDLERSRRYYGAMGDRYKLRYRRLRYILLLLCLGECGAIGVALTWPVPALIVGGLLALILVFLTVLDSVTSYGESAAELRIASLVCSDLQLGCQTLWLLIETYRVSENDAQWSLACQRVSLELHSYDNLKAAVAAHNVIADQYGGEIVPSV